MEASELHTAAESALREWPIDRRVNKAGVGDDDANVLEPIESGLLYSRAFFEFHFTAIGRLSRAFAS